ncbi:DUF4871 domain-containing protein [Ammoniphilus sp. 3BR4]|uniref:DUF4871 domain-containing protein n=1 Tax=Ammoniphilus sp. 3BR4 TaxID=3158265 RepID=UPI0034677EBD
MKNNLFVFIFLLVLIFSLTGCSTETGTVKEENWDESPTLVQEFVNQNGQKIENVFRIGDNGKLGFGEYGPFIAGESQKYMWHFWGDKETLTKPLRIQAVSKDTGEKIIVHDIVGQNLSPNNGADHHSPSSMMLPSAGFWRLDVYFGEELFGNVVVNVQEK